MQSAERKMPENSIKQAAFLLKPDPHRYHEILPGIVSPVRTISGNHLVERLNIPVSRGQPVVLQPNVTIAERFEFKSGGAAKDHELVCLARI